MLTVWACESPSSSQLLPPSSPWRIQSSSLSQRQNDSCVVEYKRVTAESRLQGLTEDDLERSIAHVGNRQRLAKLTHKLQQRLLPVSVVVCGGSISLGHGIEPRTLRYSNQLEQWLNTIYPLKKNLKNGDQKQSKHEHRVYNRGSHGADVRVVRAWICDTMRLLLSRQG